MTESYLEGEDDGWGDIELEDDSKPQLLKITSSNPDEPKLTRGFSFTLIEDAQIEEKQKECIDNI